MKLEKVNGNLYFTKYDDKNKETFSSKNALTKVFKNLILGSSISNMLTSLSGSEAGLITANTPFRYASNTGATNLVSFDKDSLPVIYLLNLTPEEQAALSEDMIKNPILTPSLVIESEKLTAWASFDYISTENKRGTLYPQTNSLVLSPVIDGEKYGITLNWAPGKIDGTFNTVILGTNIFTNKMTGASMCKGLDSANPAIGEGAAAGDFLCPNVQTVDGVVMTGPDEILLGDGASPSTARRVLNLITGECVELESTDPRYNAFLFSEPHTYIGDGRILIQSTQYTYVYNYLGTATSNNKTLSSSSTGFAISDNKIYIKNRVQSSCIFNAYDIETLTADSSSDITVSLDTSVFGTDFRNWYLSNFMGNFLLINESNADVAPTAPVNGFIFSNISDPMNSYVGPYNGNIGSDVIATDSEESITKHFYIIFRSLRNVKEGTAADNVYNPNGLTTSILRNGTKIVFDGYYGQVFTFSKLQTPITVSSTEGLLLNYMFNF